MLHSFDVDIAKNYGLNEAILLNYLIFWILKNKANEENFYDGYYWTYNSTRAFSELFPYMSQRQIQYALNHLKEEGLIQTGNYNKSLYDRTCWYALTDKTISIMQFCKMDYAILSNGLCKNVKPIPFNNTFIKEIDNNKLLSTKKVLKKEFIPPTLEEVENYCKERKNNVNAKKFFDYYNEGGWKDQTGKPVKNWKQKMIANWENKTDKKVNNDYGEVEYTRV